MSALDKLWNMLRRKRRKDSIPLPTNESENHDSITFKQNDNTNPNSLKILYTFLLLFLVQSCILIIPSILYHKNGRRESIKHWFSFSNKEKLDISTLPIELVTTKTYKYKDFCNSFGVIPTYWNRAALKVSLLDNTTNASVLNETSMYNVTQSNITEDYDIYGPCYNAKTKIKWNKIINKTQQNINYPIQSNPTNDDNLHGLCRPGFLIIGFGKCGTSSLYHYLIGHPRVLPAKKKQIHVSFFSLKKIKLIFKSILMIFPKSQ